MLKPPSDHSFPLPAIPDHELIRCIGRGSYGVVWLARSSMGIYRAVKIVYRDSFDNQRPFEREWSGVCKFEPISRLHEGFIDILHVGMDEAHGYFYYVMELGDDCELGDRIDPDRYRPLTLDRKINSSGKLSPEECLQLGLALSRALADLHKHDLVHRDVKPSNIIIVNGTPKLADLGLVANPRDDLSLVGTPGFIAPEQKATPRADVYSLGKVLYEASTGKDRNDYPDLPTSLDAKDTSHELFLKLNQVILRACEVRVARRYQTAEELYDALLLLTAGRTLQILGKIWEALQLMKRASPVVGLVFLLLAFVGFLLYREFRAAADAHQRQVGASVAYGNSAMSAGDFAGSLPHYAEALRLDEADPVLERAHRSRLGSVLTQCPRLVQSWSTGKSLRNGEFSADGDAILVSHMDKGFSAQIYSLQNPEQPPRTLSAGESVDWASLSPVEPLAGIITRATILTLWNTVTLQPTGICITNPYGIASVQFSTDGKLFVLACRNGVAEVRNVKDGTLVKAFNSPNVRLRFATFSHSGNLVATAGEDNNVVIWNYRTEEKLTLKRPHSEWVYYVAFNPTDDKLVTASADHTAKVWKVQTGEQTLPDLVHHDHVYNAEFSPDGRWLLTTCLDGSVHIWSADKLTALSSNPVLWYAGRVMEAHFSPDGRQIITSCYDGVVRIWDFAGVQNEPSTERDVFSRDGSHFFTITNNSVEIYDTISGALASPFIKPEGLVKAVRLNEDGRFIFVKTVPSNGASTPATRIYETQSGQPVGPSLPITRSLTNLILSPNGKHLAVLAGKTVQLWDPVSGIQLTNIPYKIEVTSAVFNPSSSLVATWAGSTIKVLEPVTGNGVFAPLTNASSVSHVEFSPDGSWLVGAISDGSFDGLYAQVWDAKTGKPFGPRLTHEDGVNWSSFSHDGQRIVTAGEDKTVAIWNTKTGRRITAVKFDETIVTAEFSRDDQWVTAACADHTVHIFNADTGDPIIVPLKCDALPKMAVLLPSKHKVLAWSESDNRVWLWNVPFEDRPVRDVIQLARLLTGGAILRQANGNASAADSSESLWRDLTGKYRSTFTISTNQIISWHETQLAECEAVTNVFAADFHLKWLQSLQTNNPAALRSLIRVQERLHPTKSPATAKK